MLEDDQTREYRRCSDLSFLVVLAVSELPILHKFLSKSVNMEDPEERDNWQCEAQRIDERLTNWRDEFVAAFFRLSNADWPRHERSEMDTFIVLANVVLNSAVITLLQERSPSPPGIEHTTEAWAFASNRCIYACENTAFKIRQMEEDALLNCHPHLVFSVVVAARFLLANSKAVDANVPTNLHCLAFALHTCGKRWPVAKLFELVIRVAVAEFRTPIAEGQLPKVFWDMQLTFFEIGESLLDWARGAGVVEPLQPHSTFIPMTVDALA
jgi:hypothetical protein